MAGKKSAWEPFDWETLGFSFVAGTDEAGRGCLAGPVYAGAAVLRPGYRLEGLTDSKLILPERRKILAEQIKKDALAWAVGTASVGEIEQLNILQASLLAMRRAVKGLNQAPELVIIDGNQKMGGPWNQMTLVKGDLRCLPVSAASILAKVTRDEHMESLDAQYPGYGFASHKGYGTPEHRDAISRLGPSEIHRHTFGGVREFLEKPQQSFSGA